jgi:hypothetical protein
LIATTLLRGEWVYIHSIAVVTSISGGNSALNTGVGCMYLGMFHSPVMGLLCYSGA